MEAQPTSGNIPGSKWPRYNIIPNATALPYARSPLEANSKSNVGCYKK